MRRFWLLSAVVLAFSLFLNCHYAQAKGEAVEIDLSKPDQSEVMEEVAKFTGLTKDVVELVNEEHAELFKGLDNTVFALKVVSLITEAKDTEALTEIGTKALEIVKDAVVKEAFPAAVGTFFTVASASKATLEIVRDYYWIPKNEEAIYQAYKEFRTEDRKETQRAVKEEQGRDIDEDKAEDTSVEGMNQAFDYAPFGKAYRPVREKMFDKMLEAKADTMTTSEGIKIKRKMDKDQMGPVVIADYEKKIDDFWISRMEMRYRKERMKERQAKLIKEIWAKKAQQIEAIRAAAAKLAGPQRFFLTDKDIPQGWKKVKEDPHRTYKFTPKEDSNPGNPGWVQGFSLYKAEYTQKGDDFFTADGKKVRVNDISVTIFISPRMVKWQSGTNHGEQDCVDTIKYMLDNPGSPNPGQKLLWKFMEEGVLLGYVQENTWGNSSEIGSYHIDFVKGSWRVLVGIGSSSSVSNIREYEARHVEYYKSINKAPELIFDKTMVSEELARTIARTVARKIPGGQEKQEEAKAGKKKQK